VIMFALMVSGVVVSGLFYAYCYYLVQFVNEDEVQRFWEQEKNSTKVVVSSCLMHMIYDFAALFIAMAPGNWQYLCLSLIGILRHIAQYVLVDLYYVPYAPNLVFVAEFEVFAYHAVFLTVLMQTYAEWYNIVIIMSTELVEYFFLFHFIKNRRWLFQDDILPYLKPRFWSNEDENSNMEEEGTEFEKEWEYAQIVLRANLLESMEMYLPTMYVVNYCLIYYLLPTRKYMEGIESDVFGTTPKQNINDLFWNVGIVVTVEAILFCCILYVFTRWGVDNMKARFINTWTVISEQKHIMVPYPMIYLAAPFARLFVSYGFDYSLKFKWL